MYLVFWAAGSYFCSPRLFQNFRSYFVRKVNHEFRTNQTYETAKLDENLMILQKQSIISQMYAAENTVLQEPWPARISENFDLKNPQA